MIPHPDRVALQNEIHARPPQALAAPQTVSHIALLRSPNDADADPLAALCESLGVPPPGDGTTHFLADFGEFRLKRERHGEFDGYTVYRDGADPRAPFDRPATASLPAAWLDTLPGSLIAAVHIALLPARAFAGSTGPGTSADTGNRADARTGERADSDTSTRTVSGAGAIAAMFGPHEVCAATIGDGAGRVYTDFHVDAGGFTRFVVLDESLGPVRAGRQVQRLIELEVYRMMAMLAFPLAHASARELDTVEAGLGNLVTQLEHAPVEQEPELLRELTRLAATVERLVAAVGFRFGATRAYHALVRQRGEDLRQRRVHGLQTPTAFLERRFDPAMAFCESVGRRIESSAERIARASSLLRTRVDIERERHNQELLSAMNRRARLQLNLQQTVEGLSVAAITYYAVGLAAYLFKAAKSAGAGIDVDLATGLAVVPIAVVVALGVRHIREGVKRRLGGSTRD